MVNDTPTVWALIGVAIVLAAIVMIQRRRYRQIAVVSDRQARTIARDIADQQAESARLADSERQIRLLIQSIRETVFTAGADLRFTAVYGKWEPDRRLAMDAMKGRLPTDVLGRKLGALFMQHMRRALGGETVEMERVVRWAGENRSLRLWYTPLRDDNGAIVGVTGVAYDLTEQRRAERERDALRATLEESRRIASIGRLVSGIAHEINNPLATILTLAEQLRGEARSPVDSAALEAIHAQAMRSRAIVRDLLAFVRPAHQRPVTVVRPGPLLTVALRSLQPHVMSLGVELAATITDDAVWIAADVPGLEQAITNLVINGAQSAGARGRVSVTTSMTSETFSLIVEDTGRGISSGALPHLFEPFFTTKEVGEGTGLGLFVALGIVQRHGGAIRAENRPAREGGGARFTIELPRSGPPPAGSEAVRVLDVPAAADVGARVLLVDDEVSIRASLRRFFTRKGWEVFEAGDGREALAALHNLGADSFALVLCDLRMPRMGGAELHDRLKIELPQVIERLVVVSGDMVSNESAAFIERTGVRVLEKPFELRVLGALADGLLASMHAPVVSGPASG